MNVVVIGAQWGDEGKGKIVDYLAENAAHVVRYAGGPNAGHTIVVDGKQFALHQVPSGILYPNETVYLGAGMVIDPEALFAELQMLKDNGVNWENRVFISDRAHLILPRYRQMDKDRDAARKRPIGTTGRGIGITYSEKAMRDSLRLADLDWDEKLADFDGEDIAYINRYKDQLLKMRVDLTAEMYKHQEENILFEGAQGNVQDSRRLFIFVDYDYPGTNQRFAGASGDAQDLPCDRQEAGGSEGERTAEPGPGFLE